MKSCEVFFARCGIERYFCGGATGPEAADFALLGGWRHSEYQKYVQWEGLAGRFVVEVENWAVHTLRLRRRKKFGGDKFGPGVAGEVWRGQGSKV